MTFIFGIFFVLTGCLKTPKPLIADQSTQHSNRPDKVHGSFDKQSIEDEIRRHYRQIASCYQKQLRWRPKLGGRLVVSFVIANDGTVNHAVAKEDTIDSQKVTGCIIEVFHTMQFPAGMRTDIVVPGVEPDGDVGVEVSYPFVFSPK